MSLESLKNLDAIVAEIERLKEARELLHDIWLELGPYTNSLSSELSGKLNDYFAFDDSE